MAATTEQDVQTLKNDFQSLKTDMGELSSAIKDLMSDEARVAKVKAKKAQKKVEHEVEEHPMASVGVAMGLGFIIGILLDRRLHS